MTCARLLAASAFAHTRGRKDEPVHNTFSGLKPTLISTHAAHDVRPYTNTRGKYVMIPQQRRSTFRAQAFGRRRCEGDDGGDGEPKVAILPTPSSSSPRSVLEVIVRMKQVGRQAGGTSLRRHARICFVLLCCMAE